MTDTTLTPKAPAEVPIATLTELQEMIQNAGANPATLKFPTDKWGFTSKIKTEILRTASTVKGQDDKHELLIGTLAILIAHIRARKPSDKALQARRIVRIQEAADERGPRERTTGRPVNNIPVAIPED